jgi:AIR synthase-related protein
MTDAPLDLTALAEALRRHPHVADKLDIASAYAPAVPVSGGVSLGDDAAAIADGEGYLLLAAEGMMESFVSRDPWFAGYCAVMVNVSDIAAMGGRPTAILDVLWTPDASPLAREIWAGLQAASRAYSVPIVGGHTARLPPDRTPLLAAAVAGRARKLITSFDARPGDVLLMAVDLRASYRGEGTLFWNASTDAPAPRLRGDLALLPALAEDGLVAAGKDISNGGVLGTLAMLLATSRCAATLDIDALPRPPGVDLERWLLSFPSYGYLLAVAPEKARAVIDRFAAREIACAAVGGLEAGATLRLRQGGGVIDFARVTPPPEPSP